MRETQSGERVYGHADLIGPFTGQPLEYDMVSAYLVARARANHGNGTQDETQGR